MVNKQENKPVFKTPSGILGYEEKTAKNAEKEVLENLPNEPEIMIREP